MKQTILLLIFGILISGIFIQCQDTEIQETQAGYRDEAKVREKLAEMNALLDSAIALVENSKASETYNEDQVGFVLNDEEQDSLRTLLAMIHIVKTKELAPGLTRDAGGGKSFVWWYEHLFAIDRALLEAGNNIERPLDKLRAAKQYKEATEESLEPPPNGEGD